MTRFYKGCPVSILNEEWGDYGHILQHGMCDRGDNGRLQVSRSGPFVPPITQPGSHLVVTRAAKAALETSGLAGFTFREVDLAHIVKIEWEHWDLSQEDLPEYPESGEPEDFIFARQHDPEVVKSIGDLWELYVPKNVHIIRRMVGSALLLRVDAASWNGDDLIRGHGYGGILFSERAAEWLEPRYGEYIRFEEFPAD